MTKEEKDLAWLLLQDNHYLVKSTNVNGKQVYKILREKQVPIRYFTESTVRKFSQVLKTGTKKRMTVNLSLVRQLNGNSYIKKLYKTTTKHKKN